MSTKNLVFVTSNVNKLKEVMEIVGKTFPFVISTKKIDLTETQGEPDDISRNKCLEAAKIIGGPVLVEDTCLAFHALKGLPGPYIKCFLSKLGAEGLPRLLEGFADKSASAICTFAFHSGAAEDEVVLCKGVVEGEIVTPRGEAGFGWDPIFLPDGFSKTFGEMTAAEKHDVSHRRRAVDALRDTLSDYTNKTRNQTKRSKDKICQK